MMKAEELKEISDNAIADAKAIRKARQELKDKKLRKDADIVLSKFDKDAEKRANQGLKFTTIRDVKSTQEAYLRKPCRIRHLTECWPLVYTELIRRGFDVQIQLWQETDWDEPGAFVGGYEFVVSWK